jgi:hypothetical protein
MFPKTGTVLPNAKRRSDRTVTYARMVSAALRKDLGETHRATKTLMRWTGASERTVRNWLAGSKGPSGEHLVDLVRHSQTVLEALLGYAGRDRIIAVSKLIAARQDLRELIGAIDLLIDPRSTGSHQG